MTAFEGISEQHSSFTVFYTSSPVKPVLSDFALSSRISPDFFFSCQQNIYQTHSTCSPQSPRPQAALLHSGDKEKSLRRCSCSAASPQNAPLGLASTFSHQLSTAGRRVQDIMKYLLSSSEPTPHSEHLTHLLQSDGVGLWVAVFSQVELLVQLFGQVSMTAFSKQGDFSVQLHSSLKNILTHERGGRSFNQKKITL